LAGPAQAQYIVPRLLAAGIRPLLSTYVKAINDDSVVLCEMHSGQERIQSADAVVLATMRDPIDELTDALDGKVERVYPIGDALAPRGLRDATYDGHRFGRIVGEPDMPTTVIDELFRAMPGVRPAAVA
jgi:hypothetical protein